jgi:hypothetical protein
MGHRQNTRKRSRTENLSVQRPLCRVDLRDFTGGPAATHAYSVGERLRLGRASAFQSDRNRASASQGSCAINPAVRGPERFRGGCAFGGRISDTVIYPTLSRRGLSMNLHIAGLFRQSMRRCAPSQGKSYLRNFTCACGALGAALAHPRDRGRCRCHIHRPDRTG